MKYPMIIYTAEEGGYVAEVPSLKGCLVQGETINDCLNELEIVIEHWLETAKKNNQTIPSIDSIINNIRRISAN
jgi:predicted RNase H-like HicB family nuclease